uniref:Uncharacterized protein n=1 Tax=Romanomermis culicivorax TaxID=13658 RepID=A0A915ILU5_ROMCU
MKIVSPEVNELLEQLEKTREECSALHKQIDLLLDDRTATEKKAIELMTNLCADQKRHYEKEIELLRNSLSEYEADKEHLERVKNSVTIRSQNLEKEVRRLTDELNDKSTALEEMKYKNNKETHEEIGELRAKNTNLQERLDKISEENEELSKEIATQNERRDKLIEELEQFKKMIAENEQTSSDALKQLCNELSEAKLQKADLRCRLLESERENLRLKTSQVDYIDGVSTKDEIERLQTHLDDADKKLKETTSDLKRTKDELIETKYRLDSCRGENEILRRDYDEAKHELDDRTIENHNRVDTFERQIDDLKKQNLTLKDVCKEMDVQYDDMLKVLNRHKTQNELLSDENQQLHVELQKLQNDYDKVKNMSSKERMEKEKLESRAKYWQDEVQTTEKDYKEELMNLGRLIATEKGVSLEYIKQLEQLKDSKREVESRVHLLEALLQEASKDSRVLNDEKRLFEEKMTNRIADLEDMHKEREKKLKTMLDETMNMCEQYKKDYERMKSENQQLKTTSEHHEMDIMKLNATILQYQKLNTHLQTQLNNFPKRGCFLCPDKKTLPNPNALSPERMEELLADYRQQNADLSTMVRTLQNTLKEERNKLNNLSRKPKERLEIVGRDIAIIKKTNSMSSDISTACKTTVHHKCAETLMNTCGLPMLYSDHFFEEEKRVKESLADARMYGWLKLWRSESNSWIDSFASLENGVISFFHSAADATAKKTPVARIDLKACLWKIHLKPGAELAVAVSDIPFIIE